MTQTQKLRPGSLVVLRTAISGGVQYQRQEVDPDHQEGAARVATWQTTRVIRDAEEWEKATKIRATIRNRIAGACSVTSAFGLMCPAERLPKLDEAAEEARALARDFNATARTCSISFALIRGEIATTDQEAVAAIQAEIGAMLRAMENGIAAADPKAIRDAADEAKALGAMLSDDAQGKVSAAIEEARKAAREITRRVQKGAEVAAEVVASLNLEALRAASRTFLDLEPAAEVGAPAPAPASPVETAPAEAPAAQPAPAQATLDLDPAPTLTLAARASQAPALEV